MNTLTEVPDYYSERYHYRRYPARIETRGGIVWPGTFCVWDRNVERPNPEHVTWDPETAVILADEYKNDAFYADRAEKAARPLVEVGQQIKLGDVVITVPKRAREHVAHVPCEVV